MYRDASELRIIQSAARISDEIWAEMIKWQGFARGTAGEQLVRSVDSIGANIAERHGRYYFRDVIRFLHSARGSLAETQYWLQRCKVRGLMAEETIERLLDDLENLAPQLNGSISYKYKQLRSANRIKDDDADYNHTDSVT